MHFRRNSKKSLNRAITSTIITEETKRSEFFRKRLQDLDRHDHNIFNQIHRVKNSKTSRNLSLNINNQQIIMTPRQEHIKITNNSFFDLFTFCSTISFLILWEPLAIGNSKLIWQETQFTRVPTAFASTYDVNIYFYYKNNQLIICKPNFDLICLPNNCNVSFWVKPLWTSTFHGADVPLNWRY